jgi:hypothetical protein
MVESLLKILNNLLRILKVTVATGWISLLIIGLIALLLTQLEQGSALLVSLLDSPGNLLLFMLLILALLLVIGHYPIYLMMWRRDHSVYRTYEEEDQPVRWDMEEIWGGLGWITFKEVNEKRSNTFLFRQVNYFRGVLGLLFILCLSIILNHAVKAYIFFDFPNFWVSGILFFLLFSAHSLMYYHKWRIIAFPGSYRVMHRSAFILFWMTTLTAVGAIVAAGWPEQGWNAYTFFLFTLHWLCLGLLYCVFKNFRAELKEINYLWPLSLMGHDKNYIVFNSILGLSALFIVILSQFLLIFHPLVILLAFLHLIYGIFVVILKHRFFYISNPFHPRRRITRLIFLYVMPAVLPALLLLHYISGQVGNDLHLLRGTEIGQRLSLNEFKESFYHHIDTLAPTDSTLYFIASYGGGLKANAWNLMVLDSLSHFQGKNILDQTVAMSGVSGGALGQHFHAALVKQPLSRSKKKDIIYDISRANMLSRDLAWLLGFDFLRELIPLGTFRRPDRAGEAMKQYAGLVGDPEMLKTGYQSYWAELFQSQYYPIQIGNSAGTHQRRGVACSVTLSDFSSTFPNADNLCELPENRTLTYSEAISATHRFPILSPAAKIQGKGHFVDGGYYENSGMLSLLDMYLELLRDANWRTRFRDWNVAFVQIRNDKSAYLRSQFNIDTLVVGRTRESGELRSILSTVTSIQHLPLYIESRLQTQTLHNLKFSAIDLPYRLSKERLHEVMRAEYLERSSQILRDSIILRVNTQIEGALAQHPNADWNTIEPPLARYLSQPAVDYMRVMLRNDTTLFKSFIRCSEERK